MMNSTNILNCSSSVKDKRYWRDKLKQRREKINFKKEIFGEHYNYDRVRINKNNKYFKEEVNIMNIEKNNRILFDKIKKIALRSVPKRVNCIKTEGNNNNEYSMLDDQRQTRINKRPLNKDRLFMFRDQAQRNYEKQQKKWNNSTQVKLASKKRYDSLESMLSNSRSIRATGRQSLKVLDNQQQFHHDNNNHHNRKHLLFKGKRQIQGVSFVFSIFIKAEIYNLLSQTRTTQQKIQIPLKNYNMLLKEELGNRHSNIFNLLKVQKNNKLELMGTKKLQVDLIQKAQVHLPKIDRSTQKLKKINKF